MKGEDQSKWSESTPTEKTSSVIRKYTEKSREKIEDLKDREGFSESSEKLYDKSVERFKESGSIEDMQNIKDKLIQEEKSKHSKFVEEMKEDWAEMDDKIVDSKTMNITGQSRTSNDTWHDLQTNIAFANDALKGILDSIEEGFSRVMRDKYDPDYNSDQEHDSLSSAGKLSDDMDIDDNNSEGENKSDKDNKESPLDFVINKQSSEMPDIPDSDGGD
jgi:hypothetical protein